MTGRADSVSRAKTRGQSVAYCPCRRVTASSTVFLSSWVMKIKGNHKSFQMGTRL